MHEKSQLNTEQSSRLQKKKKVKPNCEKGRENKDIRAALLWASFEKKVFDKVSSSKSDNLPYFWIIKTSQRNNTSCAIFFQIFFLLFCCINCEFTEWVKFFCEWRKKQAERGRNVKPWDSRLENVCNGIRSPAVMRNLWEVPRTSHECLAAVTYADWKILSKAHSQRYCYVRWQINQTNLTQRRYPWTFRGQTSWKLFFSLSQSINNLLHFTNRHFFSLSFQSFLFEKLFVRLKNVSKKKCTKKASKRKTIKVFYTEKRVEIKLQEE